MEIPLPKTNNRNTIAIPNLFAPLRTTFTETLENLQRLVVNAATYSEAQSP